MENTTGRRVAQLRRIRSERSLSYNRMGDEIGVTGMTVFRWLQKGLLPMHRLVLQAVDEFLARNQAHLGNSGANLARSRRRKRS